TQQQGTNASQKPLANAVTVIGLLLLQPGVRARAATATVDSAVFRREPLLCTGRRLTAGSAFADARKLLAERSSPGRTGTALESLMLNRRQGAIMAFASASFAVGCERRSGRRPDTFHHHEPHFHRGQFGGHAISQLTSCARRLVHCDSAHSV